MSVLTLYSGTQRTIVFSNRPIRRINHIGTVGNAYDHNIEHDALSPLISLARPSSRRYDHVFILPHSMKHLGSFKCFLCN
jgi:hypothetical protein